MILSQQTKINHLARRALASNVECIRDHLWKAAQDLQRESLVRWKREQNK